MYFYVSDIIRDDRILCQKLQILRNISTHFFYCKIVRDTGVLSRVPVSWLVGPLKLRVTAQLTLCLLFTFVKEN